MRGVAARGKEPGMVYTHALAALRGPTLPIYILFAAPGIQYTLIVCIFTRHICIYNIPYTLSTLNRQYGSHTHIDYVHYTHNTHCILHTLIKGSLGI